MNRLPYNAIHPKTQAAWRQWLEANHTRAEGVWLVSYKKATGKSRIEYEASVEEALCFGWIDSKVNRLDDERSMLWFAPRKPRTGWSKPNKARVERLLAAGLMHAAGLSKIEQAKADGTWNALDGVEALHVPPDLVEALAAFPRAQAHFEAFPRSVKRGILEWIVNARRPETRAARVNETAPRQRERPREPVAPKECMTTRFRSCTKALRDSCSTAGGGRWDTPQGIDSIASSETVRNRYGSPQSPCRRLLNPLRRLSAAPETR